MRAFAQLSVIRNLWAIAATAVLAAGCGGGVPLDGSSASTGAESSTTGSSSTTSATGSNSSSAGTGSTTSTTGTSTTTTTTQTVSPLTIQGSPALVVMAGVAYSFLPTSSSSASTVTYTITNQPAWATFSSVTGALTGTPSVSDVGTTSGVTITASNGVSTASIGPFSIAVTSGSATLSWGAPVANTDGSILNNLAGYNIYYGTSATALTTKITVEKASATTYVVSGLPAGTYYFAVTAYNTAGAESAQSDVGNKTI